MIEFDVMIKSLYCDYCKRFCDEHCLLCEYLKEAKEREEKKEEKKEDEKVNVDIKESIRAAVDSLRSSDRRRDLCSYLSTIHNAELITLSNIVAFELSERLDEKAIIDLLFSQLYASLDIDADFLVKLHEKVEKEVLK